MKTKLTVFFLFFCCSINAQILNAGFEKWDSFPPVYEVPQGWIVRASNYFGLINYKDTSALKGKYSLNLASGIASGDGTVTEMAQQKFLIPEGLDSISFQKKLEMWALTVPIYDDFWGYGLTTDKTKEDWLPNFIVGENFRDTSSHLQRLTLPIPDSLWGKELYLMFYSRALGQGIGSVLIASLIIDDIQLHVRDQYSVSYDVTHPSCIGRADGSISVMPTNGLPPYNYSWSNGGTTSTISNLTAGTYEVVVIDTNLDSICLTITLTDPIISSNLTITKTGVNRNDGTASVAPTGGVPPYIISWSNGISNTNLITNLPAGNYSVSVTDANGCQVSETFVIDELDCLGTIKNAGFEEWELDSIDGNMPFSLLTDWKIYPPLSEFINQRECIPPEGQFYLKIAGQIGEADWTELGVAQQKIYIPYGLDSISFAGKASFFSWDDELFKFYGYGLNKDSIDYLRYWRGLDLVVGESSKDTSSYFKNYSFQVPDSLWGDSLYLTFYAFPGGFGSYAPFSIDNIQLHIDTTICISDIFSVRTTIINPKCNGDANGSATVKIYGGTPPFNYQWSNGGTTSTNFGLTAGTYQVEVTDANGVSVSTSVTLTEPPLTATNLTTIETSINRSDGSATVAPTGGEPPYDISWSTGSMNTNQITNLPLGAQTVTITDALGCQVSEIFGIKDFVCFNTLKNVGFEEWELDMRTGFYLPQNWYSDDRVSYFKRDSCSYEGDFSLQISKISFLDNWEIWQQLIHIPEGLDSISFYAKSDSRPIPIENDFFGFGLHKDTLHPNGNYNQNDFEVGIFIRDTSSYFKRYSFEVPQSLWRQKLLLTFLGGSPSGNRTFLPILIDNIQLHIDSTACMKDSLMVSLSSNALKCNGDTNGYVKATVIGGSPPYTIAWSNGSMNTTTISDLTAGTYEVMVTDSQMESASAMVTVSEPKPIIINLTTTDETGPNRNDGTATVTSTGGESPFNLEWSNTFLDANPNINLSPGSYAISITDANGCQSSVSFVINEFACPSLLDSDVTITSPRCIGDNGSVEILVQTTNLPLTFNAGAPGEYAPGTYSFNGTDTVGCPFDGSFTIPNAEPILSNISTTNETGPNRNDGTATANPSGGTPPYMISWSDGQSGNTAINLPPGDYSNTITDNNGCTQTTNFIINNVDCNLTTEVMVNQPKCPGEEGEVIINIIGGTVPFNFDRNGSGSYAPGNYQFSGSDSDGCPFLGSFQIDAIDDFIVSETITDASCPSSADGSVSISITGGTQPYDVRWSNGMSGTTITGLSTGAIEGTITDANDCTFSISYTISAEDNLPPTISGQAITIALDDNGMALVMAEQLINAVSDDCATDIAITSDIQTFTCDDVGDNIVTLTAIDDAGNPSTTTAIVTVIDDTDPVINCPDDIAVNKCEDVVDFSTASATDNCSATVVQSEGPATGSTFLSGSTEIEFTASDASGNSATCAFTINLMSDLVISDVLTSNVNCIKNGSAEILINGGNGNPTISWSTGENGSKISDLPIGDYSVTLEEDACTLTSTFTIEDMSTSPQATAIVTSTDDGTGTGAATGSASNGDAPFIFIWTDADGNVVSETQDATGLTRGEYTLLVVDANGCMGTTTVLIDIVNSVFDKTFPGTFKAFPNPTSHFLNLEIQLNVGSNFDWKIYDGRGQLMKVSANGLRISTIEKIDISDLSSGVYFLTVGVLGERFFKKIIVD